MLRSCQEKGFPLHLHRLLPSAEIGVLGKELWRAANEVGELGCASGAAEGFWEALLVPSRSLAPACRWEMLLVRVLAQCACFATAQVAV